jgi:nucleoside phosphorylase
MGIVIDVVILIPRDHELQNFLKFWPHQPSEPNQRVFAIGTSTSKWNEKIKVCIESISDGQGLLDAYYECTKVIEKYKPRLVILAGTAGVFPGGDATLGDVIWIDGKNCISAETIKLNADSTVQFASPSTRETIARFNLDLSVFHEEWQNSLEARTNPNIKFALHEEAKVKESFVQSVKNSQLFYEERQGIPKIFRASSVFSTNSRISDPVVAQSIIAQAPPTICEMELAGCIHACNQTEVTLISIRSCSDVVGTKKSDDDSTQASRVVSDACAKFLGLASVQKTILKIQNSRISGRQRSGSLYQLIDVVEHLDKFEKAELASVAERTLQEFRTGRVSIFDAADVLVVALRGVCCGCGNNIDKTFEPFRKVIAHIATHLKPNENQEFFLKALEIFVSLGDSSNSVALQTKLASFVASGFDGLSLRETRRAVHALENPILATQILEVSGRALKNADGVDASQAAMHFSCILCQKFGLVGRDEFEKAFNEFYEVLEKIGNEHSEKSILFGKATVLNILNEWLTQEDGWLKRAESHLKPRPNVAWLTPATHVLYLTFLKAYDELTDEEKRILDIKILHLQTNPLLYACNLDVAGVLSVATAPNPRALNTTQLSVVMRAGRRRYFG